MLVTIVKPRPVRQDKTRQDKTRQDKREKRREEKRRESEKMRCSGVIKDMVAADARL